MKGKAIYQPEGAAAEYAKYACNLFKGCSNSCTYCYCKRWKWGNTPKLKKCFKDEQHALEVFEKELKENLPELQKHGLFFSFTTDLMLTETIELTMQTVELCDEVLVPVKILTKRADWVDDFLNHRYFLPHRVTHIAFGFTLTGHDELEPNASTNAERIEAMRKLHDAGFKTWASIEPIIDFVSSLQMINTTIEFCDLYKIGLKSGKKYDKEDLKTFIVKTIGLMTTLRDNSGNEYIFRRMTNLNVHKAFDFNGKIYFKDIILAQAGISRDRLPANCVDRDYNMFNN